MGRWVGRIVGLGRWRLTRAACDHDWSNNICLRCNSIRHAWFEPGREWPIRLCVDGIRGAIHVWPLDYGVRLRDELVEAVREAQQAAGEPRRTTLAEYEARFDLDGEGGDLLAELARETKARVAGHPDDAATDLLRRWLEVTK